jgi:hypothetical protein
MTGSLRHPVTRALALALLGAVLVGTCAALLALRDYPLYEAQQQIRLLADPVVGDEVVVDDRSDDDNFVDTELVTLNGPELREEVRRVTGLDDLVLDVVQVGTSNVVEVTARSSSPEVDRAAASAVERYVRDRRQALQDRILSIGGEVERQLRAAADEIRRIGDEDSVTAQVQRGALTSEYTRLLEQRNTLQVASDASERLVQVVRSAEAGGVDQVVSPLRNAALGGVVGAVLGLAAGLALNRLRDRVSGLEDLVALAPDVALPTLPALSGRSLAEQAGGACAGYVSALTRSDSGFGRPPLVVVAPTVGCGATLVAVGLAVASARRGPTVLLAAGDALDGAAASLLRVDATAPGPAGRPGLPTAFEGLTYVPATFRQDGGALLELDQRVADGLLGEAARRGDAVVVDAPALSTGSAALELARQSGQVLLVGGADVTSSAEIHAASRALRRVGATITGVVLSRPRGGGWRARRRGR